MSRNQQFARILFALGMLGLGILALVYGHSGITWYSVPKWVPWHEGVAYASGIILLGCGAGLLFERTARLSVRILLPYLVVWLLLRVPTLATAPLVEVNWQNAGELAVLVAGAWTLFANADTRTARILFALSLFAFGLSHFAYVGQTAPLVPKWLPFPVGWAYLTGAAHLAAGIGVLFSIYPQLAARLEATMLSVFTLLVWIPALRVAPTSLPLWTELVISWAITAGAWVVAESMDTRIAERGR
jgi:uncharacterized membrane protein